MALFKQSTELLSSLVWKLFDVVNRCRGYDFQARGRGKSYWLLALSKRVGGHCLLSVILTERNATTESRLKRYGFEQNFVQPTTTYIYNSRAISTANDRCGDSCDRQIDGTKPKHAVPVHCESLD